MIKRRDLLKASAIGALGSTMLALPQSLKAAHTPGSPKVKQPEDCETYFVRPDTPVTIHIAKHTDHASTISVCTEHLLPGNGIPTHKHLYADEYFYFFSGTGIVTIDGSEIPFKPGTAAIIPKNTWHSIKNTGNENAFFQFGYAPAGFEDFFRQIGTPAGQAFQPKSKEVLDKIYKEFGMVFQ